MTRPERDGLGKSRAPGRVILPRLIAILIAFGGTGRLAAAAEPDGLSGRVVDESGRGVAAARVWVLGGAWDEPVAEAETATDDQGAFAFPGFWGDPTFKKGPARFRSVSSVFARDRDGRVGWQSSVYRGNPSPIKLEVVEGSEVRGRLVDNAGAAIAGAEVAPVAFRRSSAKRSVSDFTHLSPALAGRYAARTGADGSFTLQGIPRGAKVQARVSASGFGAPHVSWDSARKVTIVLDGRTGRIEGRAVTSDGKTLEGQLSVSLRRTNPPGEGPAGSFELFYFKTLKVGGDDAIRFDEVPPGRYSISAAADPESPYQADTLPEIDVGPGARVAGITVTLNRLLTLSGRVVDATSGRGVGGVSLHAYHVTGQFLQHAGRAETDDQGRYRAHVPPGKVMVQPNSPPTAYLGVRTSDCPQFDVKADRDWPDLKLSRAATLDGVVIDGAGKPVAGAEVHVVRPDETGFAIGSGPVRTRPDGTFRLDQLDPDDTLPVRARTDTATTDGAVVIRPNALKGPLTLTVAPETSTRVRGVVKDRAKKPIAGARVSLQWGRNYVSEKTELSGVRSALESYTTDAAGRFNSSALWPGDRYNVTVQAEGYGRAETPEVSGRAGDSHDFGTITLVGIDARVAGQVVDTAGHAVEGVTVFNNGDAPAAVSATTGVDGRFRLDGLLVGGKYVFARKPGYRFAGVRVVGEADDVTVTLRRADEPPPLWSPAAPKPDDQKALAKKVLTRVWGRYGKDANKNGAFVCILHMARIDPALALKWSADTGGRYDGRVSHEAAEGLAETDAEGALELLQAPGVGNSQHIVLRLAERFSGEDRGKALRFAEEAAVQARAMDQPDRAGAMARTGALLAKLGRKDAGLKLIDEAAGAARKMGTEGRQAYARGNVAGALAPFDLARALALVEPIKAVNERDRYTGFVASAVAATDPGRAVALADAMNPNSSLPQSLKLGVAYALGADRPDEAVRVIEGMKGYNAPKYQAEAFGWLAVAVAPKDKKRAEALIERALAMPVDQPDGFRSWTYFGGGTGSAAWVAACARRAGYPDMAGAVAYVLASRQSASHQDPAMEIGSLTIAALALAVTDPSAARQILRDIEARAGLSPAELSKVAGSHWLAAWALADPEHAEELFEAELAALEGQTGVDLQRTGLLKMAEVLAVPPHRREVFLRGHVGATWHPDMPD